MKRLVMVVLGGMVFCGCTTTSGGGNAADCQMRLARLESQERTRDERIEDLQSRVQELQRGLQPVRVRMEEGTQEVEALVTNPGIIRVSVTSAEVQKALKGAGYYDGPIDGKLGKKSVQAIRDFQREHDLKSDGIIGAKTWDQLKEYIK